MLELERRRLIIKGFLVGRERETGESGSRVGHFVEAGYSHFKIFILYS